MEEKQQKLVKIIEEMDPTNADNVTNAGLPTTKALSDKLGEAVSAAERDIAWSAFAEAQPEAATAFLEAAIEAEKASDDEDEEPAEAVVKVEKASDVKPVTGQDALKAMRAKGIKV